MILVFGRIDLRNSTCNELLLRADLEYLLLETLHLAALVLHAGEYITQKGEEQGNVLGHELRLHGLAHGLDTGVYIFHGIFLSFLHPIYSPSP